MPTVQEIIASYKNADASFSPNTPADYKTGRDLWDAIKHGGKERIGSVRLSTGDDRAWKVRVRRSGKRGRYLKINSKDGSGLEIRATADQYRPDEYRCITPEEWTVLALFAEGRSDWQGRRDDGDLATCAQDIITRITTS